MKKREAIFNPFKLDAIEAALAKERIQRFSLLEVKGAGCQQITFKQYRGVGYSEDSSEVSVTLVNCNSKLASKIAEPFDTAQGERSREKPFVVRLSNHER